MYCDAIRRCSGILVCMPPLQALLTRMPPLSDHWPNRREIIRYVLALASPADCVFDAHGLYAFRPHATYYYRLAIGTRKWLRAGFIPETDIINDLRRSQCKVAIFSRAFMELPPNLLRFLHPHFVSTGLQGKKEVHVA